MIFFKFALSAGSALAAEMAAGTMDPAGRSNTTAGKICGIIGTCLSVAGIVIQLILLALGGTVGLLNR